MSNKMTLQQQADAVLKQAEDRGVQSNFFFVTTFKRYQVQMKILSDLEKAIAEYGATVTKEYVKGRQNLVANPAITEYNKTATAANGTVSTLINIVKSLSNEPDAMDALSDGEYTPRLESEGGIYTAEGFGKSGKVITLHPISDSMIRGLLVRCYELEDSVLMLKKNVKALENACHGHKIFDFERKET